MSNLTPCACGEVAVVVSTGDIEDWTVKVAVDSKGLITAEHQTAGCQSWGFTIEEDDQWLSERPCCLSRTKPCTGQEDDQ
jgi:hypothetical protein